MGLRSAWAAAATLPERCQCGRRGDGRDFYIQYFFPGTLVLILLFTAIFATISVIEDRREGFLQSVLVAPIPRWSMVLGKLVGGTLIAVTQAALFLFWAIRSGCNSARLVLVAVIAWMFVISLGADGAWVSCSPGGPIRCKVFTP